MNNLVAFKKILWLDSQRYKTKFFKCLYNIVSVLRLKRNPCIKIFGIARISVKCDSISTNYQISDAMHV